MKTKKVQDVPRTRADSILQNSTNFNGTNLPNIGQENAAPRRSKRRTEVSRRLLFNSVSCILCGRHVVQLVVENYICCQIMLTLMIASLNLWA